MMEATGGGKYGVNSDGNEAEHEEDVNDLCRRRHVCTDEVR